MAVNDKGVAMPISVVDCDRIQQVGMAHFKRFMRMVEFFGICRGPEADCYRYGQCGHQSERDKGERETHCRAKPTREGVGDQAAGMGKRELSRKERRPVFWMRRAAEQSAGRRLRH